MGIGWNEKLHQITRLPSESNDAPSITVLVHGQGGEASHWSNDSNYDFSYDDTSLISTLVAKQKNSNVYWAKFTGNKIKLIDISDNNYSETKNGIAKIEDTSKHIILVFESYNPDNYHREVYEELHKIIAKLQKLNIKKILMGI